MKHHLGEHVSSQLMALGLLTATAGTNSGFLLLNLIFFQLSFELSKSLIVSMCAHS
jgi:hypothetical protein